MCWMLHYKDTQNQFSPVGFIKFINYLLKHLSCSDLKFKVFVML